MCHASLIVPHKDNAVEDIWEVTRPDKCGFRFWYKFRVIASPEQPVADPCHGVVDGRGQSIFPNIIVVNFRVDGPWTKNDLGRNDGFRVHYRLPTAIAFHENLGRVKGLYDWIFVD